MAKKKEQSLLFMFPKNKEKEQSLLFMFPKNKEKEQSLLFMFPENKEKEQSLLFMFPENKEKEQDEDLEEVVEEESSSKRGQTEENEEEQELEKFQDFMQGGEIIEIAPSFQHGLTAEQPVENLEQDVSAVSMGGDKENVASEQIITQYQQPEKDIEIIGDIAGFGDALSNREQGVHFQNPEMDWIREQSDKYQNPNKDYEFAQVKTEEKQKRRLPFERR